MIVRESMLRKHTSFKQYMSHVAHMFSQIGKLYSTGLGLVQDRSISIAYALEILQSCTKPSTYLSTAAE